MIGTGGKTRSISVPNLDAEQLGMQQALIPCLTEAVAAIRFTEPPRDFADRVMPVVVEYPLVLKPTRGVSKPEPWDVSRPHIPPRWRWTGG